MIGRRFNDVSVQHDKIFWPFQVIAGPSEKPVIVVNFRGVEKQFSPEEISSMVLLKMKVTAEAYIGSLVKNFVVIHFPLIYAGNTLDYFGIGGGNVGPDHPIFGMQFDGQRPVFPGAMPPGVPPGACFDPYGPPGVPGFEPNRFARHVCKYRKKTQNLESEMEVKVNKKVQENMTWLLKKLKEADPDMKIDIGDFCPTASSEQDDNGTPITPLIKGGTTV